MAVKVKRRGIERKKSQHMKAAWQDDATIKGWWNEALALVLFALTLFLTMSVLAEEFGRSFQNLIGPFGKTLGSSLTHLLGWCSLVPVLWLGWLAAYCWNLDERSPTVEVGSNALPIIGLLLMLVFSSALAALFWGERAGGAIGVTVSETLAGVLGGIGTAILCGSFVLASLSLSTRQSIGVIVAQAALFLRQSVGLVFILIPVYALRTLFLLTVGLWNGIGWIYDQGVNYFRPKNSISLKPEEEDALPKPRRRTRTRDDESSKFELNGEGDSRKVPVMEDALDSDAGDDEEYSHVVVMRRQQESYKPTIDRAKRAREKEQEEDFADSEIGDFTDYKAPELSLLTHGEPSVGGEDDEELLEKSRQIEAKLKDFSILGRVTEVHPGPVITLFEFEPAPGVKVGRIAALQDDLAMSLRATAIRIIAPIPKKGTVGIEVPNRTRDIVRLRDVLERKEFMEADSKLTVPLGKDTYGDPEIIDITTMPHILIAGATGTGKSVCLNALLLSLLYRASPAELGLILIDPKVLELSVYEGVPHLRVPVVTVAKQAKAVLDWAVKEMERRYRMMQRFGVKNVDGYNALVKGTEDSIKGPKKLSDEVIVLHEEEVVENGIVDPIEDTEVKEKPFVAEELKPLPKIVIVIDELADLMLTVGREVEELITRLAQKARAAGIHLIVATQRPSVDVITGLIKANFPARISFRVSTRIDSRTILDSMGAERLLGFGDMLMLRPGAHDLRRIHGAYVSDQEVHKVVAALKEAAKPCYDQRIIEICERALEEDPGEGGEGALGADEYDSVYDKAVELVVQRGQASTSMIQRAFRIGYNRAARIIETMERDGVIGPMDGVKPREVLVQSETQE